MVHEGLGKDISWQISMLDDQWHVLTVGAEKLPDFEWRKYTQPSATWDHDHCVGCTVKFMQTKHEGTLLEGWASINPNSLSTKNPDLILDIKDGSLLVGPPSSTFEWLCDDCHQILAGLLDGSIEPKIIDRNKGTQ